MDGRRPDKNELYYRFLECRGFPPAGRVEHRSRAHGLTLRDAALQTNMGRSDRSGSRACASSGRRDRGAARRSRDRRLGRPRKQAAGDYATSTDTETILAKRHQGVGNDVAALKGARFVAAAEMEQGRVLAESKVKQLTGSDTVTARFLYSEPFDFKPEFKLWLSTNNKPVIRGTDDAIWDRIRLIPFTRRFEGANADSRLPEKLRKELPGVLAWMVRGCLEWRKNGLGEPERVIAATEGYRGEMDTLGGCGWGP